MATIGTVTVVLAALTGGEWATIIVSVITAAGATFGVAMSNRARRYEIDLSHEETQIHRMREDRMRDGATIDKLRARIEELRDENHDLEVANTRLQIAMDIYHAQLTAGGIDPKVPRPS